MACIPKNHWTSQKSDTKYFHDFRVEVLPEVKVQLQVQLDCLPVEEQSINVLQLDCSAQDGNAEGYQIEIRDSLIRITATSAKGLYYGLATLKLLLITQDRNLHFGTITDTPAFNNRGIMLDVSRGKMPTLEYLKNLVGFLSDLKYNILQLYSEDKLRVANHPAVGELSGAYTENQIRELDEFCQNHFVELQPCIQSYSHMHGILRRPGYAHLAENEGLFSLAAGSEAVYKFLEDTFEQTLPWFSSTTLNVNMDEAYDIGTGFSKQAVERLGKGEVFLAHIHRVVEIARRHGAKRILLWGDFANKYPYLIEKLPRDTVMIDWNYNPQQEFPSLEVFEKMTGEFWVAGGVSSWNSVFPRVYNSYTNLIGYSKAARLRGAQGFLVTDWGDYGHMQPLGLSLYGYMIGAQQAFNPNAASAEEIEEQAWPLMFCDENMQTAFRQLMDSNLSAHLQTGFKTMSIYYFFDDLFKGLALCGNDKYPQLTKETFPCLHDCGRKALELLERIQKNNIDCKGYPDENWRALFGESFLKELLLSARVTKYVGAKGELSFQIRERLQEPTVSADDILKLIEQVRGLYSELCQIRQQFSDVWMLRAYATGIETSFSLFDRAGVQLYQATKWLAKQLRLVQQGKTPDADFQTYCASDEYEILWTSDFKNMWDRAYPWQ